MTPETQKRANEITSELSRRRADLESLEKCMEKPGIYFRAKHLNTSHVVDLQLSAPLLNIMAKMVVQDLKEQIAELEQEYREL